MKFTSDAIAAAWRAYRKAWDDGRAHTPGAEGPIDKGLKQRAAHAFNAGWRAAIASRDDVQGGSSDIARIRSRHEAAFPQARQREDISKVSGYKRSSRDTYIHRLSARRLVDIVGTEVRASSALFTRGGS